MSEVYAFWMDEKVDKCGSEKNLRNAVIAGQRFSQVALGAPAEVATFASPSEPRIQPLQCPKQNDILVLHELLWYRLQEMSMSNDRQQMFHETVYELQYIAEAASPDMAPPLWKRAVAQNLRWKVPWTTAKYNTYNTVYVLL